GRTWLFPADLLDPAPRHGDVGATKVARADIDETVTENDVRHLCGRGDVRRLSRGDLLVSDVAGERKDVAKVRHDASSHRHAGDVENAGDRPGLDRHGPPSVRLRRVDPAVRPVGRAGHTEEHRAEQGGDGWNVDETGLLPGR